MKTRCFLLFALTVLSGCDPAVRYRFVLRNNSRIDLTATFSTWSFKDSLVVVKCDSTKLLFEHMQIGTPRELKQNEFENIFRKIEISMGDRVVYTQAPADKTRWRYGEEARKNFFFGKIGKSIYTLTLDDSTVAGR
jgi:hypothetical protein